MEYNGKIKVEMSNNQKAEIEVVIDTITINNLEIRHAIIQGLLLNGYKVRTKDIIDNGIMKGIEITIIRIENMYY